MCYYYQQTKIIIGKYSPNILLNTGKNAIKQIEMNE